MCNKVRKVKPYLCSDCGTTNTNDFYGKSKGKCKFCQNEYRKKSKIAKPKKLKPHLCKHCGTTNPDHFELGFKTTCHSCELELRRKTEPRKVKAYLCSKCGTTNPNDFYGKSKGKCKSCKNPNPKYKMPHLCSSCGTTDPTEFYSKRKNQCKACNRKANRKTNRIIKPSKIIIPDHITDPIERKKYYKKIYAKNYFIENKTKLNQQHKINDKKSRIRKYCKKHNINPDQYLNDFDKYNQLFKKKEKIIECKRCKSLDNINYHNGYGHLCNTCSENIKKNYPTTKKIYKFDFIKKAQFIHDDKPYTYEKVIYKNGETKVEITCQKHGSFNVVPSEFVKTLIPCKKCRKETLPNTNTIIEQSKEIYGDNTFDYSKTKYINRKTKITFICKKHNHEFEQLIYNHKRKKIGCYHCLNFSEKRFNLSKIGGTIAGANKKIKSANKPKKKYKDNNNINSEKITKFIQENTINVKSISDIKKYKDKIREFLRTAIIKQKPRNKKETEKILGCSIQEARDYLESKFEPWMNWSNYGKHKKNQYNIGWDIDHISPLTTAHTIEDVNILNHYTNLQPLCSEYNRFVKKDLILQ